MGETSATRLRSKVLGTQKIQANQILQYMRGNASSALAKINNAAGF